MPPKDHNPELLAYLNQHSHPQLIAIYRDTTAKKSSVKLADLTNNKDDAYAALLALDGVAPSNRSSLRG